MIPQIGGLAKIENRAYHGSYSKLISPNTGKFCAKAADKIIHDARFLEAE